MLQRPRFGVGWMDEWEGWRGVVPFDALHAPPNQRPGWSGIWDRRVGGKWGSCLWHSREFDQNFLFIFLQFWCLPFSLMRWDSSTTETVLQWERESDGKSFKLLLLLKSMIAEDNIVVADGNRFNRHRRTYSRMLRIWHEPNECARTLANTFNFIAYGSLISDWKCVHLYLQLYTAMCVVCVLWQLDCVFNFWYWCR